MPSMLQRVLQVRTPTFTLALRQLESAAGRSGVDTRLIADMLERAHRIMRSLRLNPADTTAWELHQALIAHCSDDDLLRGCQFVAIELDKQVISFNQQDLLASKNGSFDDRSLSHMQNALKAEIVDRYVNHPATNDQFVKHLAIDAGIFDEVNPYTKPVKSEKEGNEMDQNQKTPTILAVGDINTNAFIKLTEDHIGSFTDDEGYERITIELGAKLPYDGVEVIKVNECSPNAAVSLSRLGLDSHLMAWVGGDEVGKEMIDYLKEENVGTSSMVVEQDQKSNYHYVLRYGADRTKLQRFEDFSYQWKDPEVKPDWLYLGVLGEDTWDLHQQIMAYLEANPDIKLVFQPGMYHLMWGAEKLAEFYRHAHIVIMNREEAAQVTGKSRESVEGLLDGLHDLGVKVAVVTDGPAGAYASDGEQKLFMPNYPDPKEPFERTGAGDAFASTIVAALALGEPLETALRWAPINSAYVVQQMGAQAGLLTRDELKGYLDNAPEWYHTKPLSEV